jgi:hypothetical protein
MGGQRCLRERGNLAGELIVKKCEKSEEPKARTVRHVAAFE